MFGLPLINGNLKERHSKLAQALPSGRAIRRANLKMNILAIDTAHAAVSACLLAGESLLARETVPMVRGHGEALLPMIDRVMADAKLAFSSIDRVAVVVGPGSFTGIRIGIAAARAIGFSNSAPVIGVSSLAAFAAPLLDGRSAGVIAAAIDAKHGQVYVQGITAKGQLILSPTCTKVRDAVRALGAGPLKLTGSGAAMMAIEAWSMGMEAEVVGETTAPDIKFVARLGGLADPEQAIARPYYLKAPDAKIMVASGRG
jgi:tRNA threonylcarbamoyl adenosine modification protein YeaZ